MIELRKNRTAASRPSGMMALLAAVLIVGAQLVALAHYHQEDSTRRIDSHAEVVADSGLCALCILAVHLPLNPAAAPAIERPVIDVRPSAVPVDHVITCRPHSICLTRAPPTTPV